MKLISEKNRFESNVDDKDALEFGIGDVTKIIEIFRNHIYQNKVQTPVQEYISNARDANRESGATRPIEVTFPTKANPIFKVRDWGPGVTPDRMENVFVKYGASTKTASNGFTGGFGVGCKSAWAYTDSFTVTTFIDGIKRVYVAEIASSQTGKINKLSETETTEPNGTEISYAARFNDIHDFSNAIIRATTFWTKEEYPVFHNVTGIYVAYQKEQRAKSIQRFMGTNMSGIEVDVAADDDTTIVIDGIPYDMPDINLREEDTLREITNSCHLNVFIPNGLVAVAVSREQIDDSDFSKSALKQIFTAAISDFKKAKEKWEEEIVDSKTLLAANKKTAGFKLSSDKTFDFITLYRGNYHIKIDRHIEPECDNEGSDDYNERLFSLNRLTKSSKDRSAINLEAENVYYLKKPGDIKHEEIRNWIHDNQHTTKIDEINLVTIVGSREEIKHFTNDKGEEYTSSKYKRNDEIVDELLEVVERLGFKNIEDLIPKKEKVKKDKKVRPKGNIIQLDDWGNETVITLESLDAVTKSGIWIYYEGAKNDYEFKNVFLREQRDLKDRKLIEKAFRVLEKNKKAVEADDRFIKLDDFYKNWTPTDKNIQEVIYSEFGNGWRDNKSNAFYNLFTNISDKNNVLYQVAAKQRSSNNPRLNYRLTEQVKSTKEYKDGYNKLETISKFIDRYMPFADLKQINSPHMKEYIKWCLDKAESDGMILSIPDILIKKV